MRLTFARANQLIHTWLGIVLSLWVLLMAITGTTLYYKPQLLKLSYPALNLATPLSLSQAATQLDNLTPPLTDGYAYMPTAETPWLEVVDANDTHWYFGEDGVLLGRPHNGDVIAVMVSLHHNLMLGETGKKVTGIFGIASLVLIITGLIRWWPKHRLSRRHFSIHWFRLSSRKGLQTLGELHKVSATLLFVPLTVLLLTGTAIIYSQSVKSVLISIFPQQGVQPTIPPSLPNAVDWQARFDVAQTLFAEATPRLIYLSQDRIRLKHEQEWHPNGRNYLTFSGANGEVSEFQDVRQTSQGNQLSHTIYPLHVAAIGGLAYLIICTLAGLTLVLLPVTGIGYWLKRQRYRRRH